VELQFAAPELAELDALESEVLACTLFEDVRPADGVAGMCDWRLAGKLSRLQRCAFLTGAVGEVLMLPGRPKLGFDKLLLFGAGPRHQFDDVVCRAVITRMLRVIGELCSRVAVVELPGRQADLLSAEVAADRLLEIAADTGLRAKYDVWTLVEDAASRRRIEKHMVEERRRRRAPI